jgi:hypothetical protein
MQAFSWRETANGAANKLRPSHCLCFLVHSHINIPFVCRQYFKAAYYYLDEPQRMSAALPREIPNWEEELGPDGAKGAIPLDEFSEHVVKRSLSF